MYRPVLQRVDPHLCLILRTKVTGEPIALLFCLADGDRIVIKTLAVAAAWRGRGLGGQLLKEAICRSAGRFQTAVFALMHEDNLSSRMVSRLASPCRRYALFGQARRGGGGA
jgi:ribosomal protein S18 acetylase RimI-like enzyme